MRIYEAGLRSAYSRSHRAVIRAYDEARSVIETCEQTLRRGYSITMNALNRTEKLRPSLRSYHHHGAEVGGVIELARFPIRHPDAPV